MKLIEFKSETPWRVVNIGTDCITFNKDCLAFIPEALAKDLESNPFYKATGKTKTLKVEVKKDIEADKKAKIEADKKAKK